MTGGIDLSVGSVAALGSVASALASPYGVVPGLAAGVGAEDTLRDDQCRGPEADHGLREQARAGDAAWTPGFGEAARRRRTQAQEQGGGEQRGQGDEPVDEESHNEEKGDTYEAD